MQPVTLNLSCHECPEMLYFLFFFYIATMGKLSGTIAVRVYAEESDVNTSLPSSILASNGTGKI